MRSPVGRKTGNLLNSLEVTVGGTDEEPEYVVSFEDYGLFLDEGVKGTISGISGQGYLGLQIQYSGSYKMIGGNLPIAVRVSIHKYGLKPRPWVQNAMDAIADVASQRIETDLAVDIEQTIVERINSIPTINIDL